MATTVGEKQHFYDSGSSCTGFCQLLKITEGFFGPIFR